MADEPKVLNRRQARSRPLFDRKIAGAAIGQAFVKLNPATQWRNPVMFVTGIGALITTILAVQGFLAHTEFALRLQVSLWLWLTVLFANFAEAVAEGRGKAQAESLRRGQVKTMAVRIKEGGAVERVPSHELRKGDLVQVVAGEIIPLDGTVEQGAATVDESALTGESAPVIREAGGDRSAVTGGTRVLSDRIRVRITVNPGESFLDRLIGMVEGAQRQKTPNEVALSLLISGLTLIFLLVILTLPAFAAYSQAHVGITVLVALLVCLIPTTIGGLLSAIGIAGMDRLLGHNIVAKSGRSVEAAGDIDIILLDKTGTITYGNRQAVDLFPAPGVTATRLRDVCLLASLADETPEGRSIVDLASKQGAEPGRAPAGGQPVAFTAETRMSGMDFKGRQIRKGAPVAVLKHVTALGGTAPADLKPVVDRISNEGGTPLLVSENEKVLGVIHLKDVVKPGIRDRLRLLRRMGIRSVMITGDNPLTAKHIAEQAGVDDFIAEAKPEQKLAFIRAEQAKGQLVAMIGDGTNDAPALAQADVGVAMNTGTQAAREAGNMVDLDSSPTKLIDVIEIGKELLITRGALTTFSVANDVAKYFAIVPAMFVGAQFAGLKAFNVMGLTSPQSAILSAVIFNALIIIALIPLALRGVKFKPAGAKVLLRRNLLIYGLGGIVAPFIGIKLIDLLLTALGLA
jgi:K+-transporting ATPase ATPase B chain